MTPASPVRRQFPCFCQPPAPVAARGDPAPPSSGLPALSVGRDRDAGPVARAPQAHVGSPSSPRCPRWRSLLACRGCAAVVGRFEGARRGRRPRCRDALVALGVLLGQRTAPDAPSAAATGPYPVVVEAKAPTRGRAPPPAVAGPGATRRRNGRRREDRGPRDHRRAAAPCGAAAERPRAGPSSHRRPRRGRGTVDGRRPRRPLARLRRRPSIGSGSAQARPRRPIRERPGGRARTARRPPRPRRAPVDPLVQAVREDIREDEARTK